MSNWRPIETAPKALAFSDDPVHVLAFDPGGHDGRPPIISIAFWLLQDEDGDGTWVSENELLTDFHPTHWMPLPSPPDAPATPREHQ